MTTAAGDLPTSGAHFRKRFSAVSRGRTVSVIELSRKAVPFKAPAPQPDHDIHDDAHNQGHPWTPRRSFGRSIGRMRIDIEFSNGFEPIRSRGEAEAYRPLTNALLTPSLRQNAIRWWSPPQGTDRDRWSSRCGYLDCA